jgi:hypothetical protein
MKQSELEMIKIRASNYRLCGYDERWITGKRTRLEHMRKGTHFLDCLGHEWILERNANGVIHTKDASGKTSLFAGCASGVILR